MSEGAGGEPIQGKDDRTVSASSCNRFADIGDAGDVILSDSVLQAVSGKELEFQLAHSKSMNSSV